MGQTIDAIFGAVLAAVALLSVPAALPGVPAALLGVPAALAGLPEPPFTPLDLHPVDQLYSPGAKPVVIVMPKIVRQGVAKEPDQRQIQVPLIIAPSRPDLTESSAPVGKSGTGFFIGGDGTLLTAAHVVTECRRLQVVSQFLSRTWVSLLATDLTRDIALLKAADIRPPAVLRIASGPPVSQKLLVLGFPAATNRLTPTTTWADVENQKFPASIGPLADPRELLWMSAPDVTHGFSGGPIFDPALGAVIGLVKGEVDGGYLRLVRNMPTTGIAIGPGAGALSAFLRREAPYVPVAVAAATGEAGEETARRASVRVLCWQ